MNHFLCTITYIFILILFIDDDDDSSDIKDVDLSNVESNVIIRDNAKC